MARFTAARLGACLLSGLLLAGCKVEQEVPRGERFDAVDGALQRKYGKGFDELPTRVLVVISPHNANIRNEYAWAFSMWHALAYGQKVHIEHRSVGGGTSTIKTYLLNVYQQSETSGIDLLWGGGRFPFFDLAQQGLLQPLKFPPDLRAELRENVPPTLAGIPQYDRDGLRWYGTATSGFGFIYNKRMLRKCGIDPPKQWEDLARRELAGLLSLADPTQSGSAAAAYQLIAQSGETWPEGWAKLLRVLANAKDFSDSAGAAANAPMLGEALVATAIDFYGMNRVLRAPEELAYVSPEGETTFGPDPIGILKNPPHPELAQRFVNFTLTRAGQRLLCLPPGTEGGPLRSPLGRQPVRKDIYRLYKDELLPGIVNPYEKGFSLRLTEAKKQIDYLLLKYLVKAAAVDNLPLLSEARDRLIETDFEPSRLAEFSRLPADAASLEALDQTRKRLDDPKARERIVTRWRDFFAARYRKVAR